MDDAWQMSDGSSALAARLDDVAVDDALLAYAQRAAARSGAKWFAAELQRREEQEQRERQARAGTGGQESELGSAAVADDHGLIDASAEAQLLGGAPSSLGIGRPQTEAMPVVRHPHVPRPPAVELEPEPKRRRRARRPTPEPSTLPPHITAPRMSPGARRLYGLDDPRYTADAG